jgi:hypothetical protein
MSWVQKVDSQSVLMIKTPHPFHTHRRSTVYIYSVSAPGTVASGHKDADPALYLLLGEVNGCCGCRRWFSVSSYN